MRDRPFFRALFLVAVGVVLGWSASAPAEEPVDGAEDGSFDFAPDPTTATGPDADLFRRGLELQREGKYRSARKAFFKLADEYPDSPFCDEAEDRSGDLDGNAFLGFTPMHSLGPTDRRIDVALMGDGYPLDKQDRFDKAAVGHIDVLMYEEVYSAYRPYFNFYRYNLASKDDGVDEVERAPPDDELETRRKTRKKKRAPKEFSTALDCKAAGPAGQVMANPSRVWHYLAYLKENDGLAICFAQKGQLGMGGMGIATTGPKGVVVHEFGHAFVGLLDEYQNNPGAPFGQVEAPNATTNKDRPPWQHFLDAKIPGIGVFEGGATYVKGVWRPASSSCAMNVGGSAYCPVCKEAAVLMIYGYVSPIDEASPNISTVRRGASGWPMFSVTPKQPTTHDIEVTWFLDAAPNVTPSGEPAPTATGDDELEGMTPLERRLRERLKRREQPGSDAGDDGAAPTPFPFRAAIKRRSAGTGNDEPPKGKAIRAKRAKTDGGWRSEVTLPELAQGKYVLTAVVRDPVKPKGSKHPWVLKDDRGLLEDRVQWTLEVPDGPPGPEKR